LRTIDSNFIHVRISFNHIRNRAIRRDTSGWTKGVSEGGKDKQKKSWEHRKQLFSCISRAAFCFLGKGRELYPAGIPREGQKIWGGSQ